MVSFPPPGHASGVLLEASSAAWRGIRLAREAWEVALTQPQRAVELWRAASNAMELAAAASADSATAAGYLDSAASLALCAGDTPRASTLAAQATSVRAHPPRASGV